MSQGIELLDEALSMARQEKMALEGGAYEEAIELAGKRGELTGMAWNLFKPSDTECYRKRITELASIQNQLVSLAQKAQTAVKQKLNRSRIEKKRIQGYHMAVGQALQ